MTWTRQQTWGTCRRLDPRNSGGNGDRGNYDVLIEICIDCRAQTFLTVPDPIEPSGSTRWQGYRNVGIVWYNMVFGCAQALGSLPVEIVTRP